MNGMTTTDWDKRYEKGGKRGLKAPGTFAHTEAGNAQFYRAKCDALDRCSSLVGASFHGKRVLDAAGGSGQFVSYYLSRGAQHVTITDYSQVALQFVRERWKQSTNVNAVFMDLTQYVPEIGRSPYDIVLVQEAIFLLPDDDGFRAAIANLAGYLNSGGLLLISDAFPEQRAVASSYVVRRPRSMFEESLVKNGLHTVGYVLQTALFNRCIFGKAQLIIEQIGSLYYWLDRIAQWRGIRCSSGEDIKYLIARKEQNTETLASAQGEKSNQLIMT